MKSGRSGMAMTGWVMTIAGSGTVLFWLAYEAVSNFASSPVATLVSVIVVLGLMALLVPVPLLLATRRAKARRSQIQ
ncbi:MAG: hypothetical protein JWO42_3622 [Chloroflexi bacterium]|nr:hypothetical protein [Chloroflexota bacterium]